MNLLITIATTVLANVSSYYICKWLDDRRR